jgi:hypothetical protein
MKELRQDGRDMVEGASRLAAKVQAKIAISGRYTTSDEDAKSRSGLAARTCCSQLLLAAYIFISTSSSIYYYKPPTSPDSPAPA